MYEYTLEPNSFGIVDLTSGTPKELDGYDKFASAMSKHPAPTGNGGAAASTHAVPCPTSDSVWEVDPTLVPSMPKEAQKVIYV
jgi:1,3-beta-glucanosyltransferase GAS5